MSTFLNIVWLIFGGIGEAIGMFIECAVNKEYSFARFARAHEELEQVKQGNYVKRSYLEEKPSTVMVEVIKEDTPFSKEGADEAVKPHYKTTLPKKYPLFLSLFPLIIAVAEVVYVLAICLVGIIRKGSFVDNITFLAYAKLGILGDVIIAFVLALGIVSIVLPALGFRNNIPEINRKYDSGLISIEQAYAEYRKGKTLRILFMILSFTCVFAFGVLSSAAHSFVELINLMKNSFTPGSSAI